jgi:HD-GYP domain-containing protein (c-di-GMP phosphodiesterase class II)
MELGRFRGLSAEDLRVLHTAAVLHDIGKTTISDHVLAKQTPYTADDWAIMKSHSAQGQRIIVAAGLDDGDRIGLVVRHHHERFDGAGYPDGLAGEAIPVMARIIAIADAYDAMGRTRVYRNAMPHDEIMRILLNERGRQHDPRLSAQFAAIIQHSPFRTR